MDIKDVPILPDDVVINILTDQLLLGNMHHDAGGQVDFQDSAVLVEGQVSNRRKIVKILKLIDSLQKRLIRAAVLIGGGPIIVDNRQPN